MGEIESNIPVEEFFLNKPREILENIMLLELKLEEIQARAEHITSVLSEARSSNHSVDTGGVWDSVIDSKDKYVNRIAEELLKAYRMENAVERFIRRNIKDGDYRRLLLMRYVNGMSTSVIASLLGVSQRTVQRELNKALQVAQAKYEQKNRRKDEDG